MSLTNSKGIKVGDRIRVTKRGEWFGTELIVTEVYYYHIVGELVQGSTGLMFGFDEIELV